MSNSYVAVIWNRQKKIYDGLLLGGVVLYLVVFVVLNGILHPTAPAESSLIRAFGTASLILLHIILCIGPLCRLDKRFLPLLYNRRHMGVTMFLLGLAHAALVIMQYHAFGDMNPIASIFLSSNEYNSLSDFPFQPLGFFALVILFLMAATSHDFWLSNLSAPTWKRLHTGVYIAYALLVGHVALGIMQSETSPALVGALGLGMIMVIGLHLAAGWKEKALDTEDLRGDDYIDIGAVEDIREKRARIVTLSGERVAIFKYDGKVSAVSNVCQHQNGPLGEGKIIDGCITCPWHGYQYKPEDGSSPPPFTEKICTFNVKVKDGRVLVHPKPNPAGTKVEPALIDAGGEA